MELITTDGFDAAKSGCEDNPDAINANTYFASKHAINAWTAWRSFSLMTDHGLRPNCTNPGPTRTPTMSAFSVGMELGEPIQGPIGRFSPPEEQARALSVPNRPRLGYVIGGTFYTSGGLIGVLQTGQLDLSKQAPLWPSGAMHECGRLMPTPPGN